MMMMVKSRLTTGTALTVLLLAATTAILFAGAASATNTPISLLFTQRVDHFNASNTATWQQRYFLSGPLSAVAAGAPIFFYVGPESETGSWAAQEGTFEQTTWAINMGGVTVAVEHRFFGQSLPFGNSSWSEESLAFLSVEQALADYAAVLQYVLQQVGSRPVISFGGSYGGFLSAAFRVKYPKIVSAAIASGAPVYLFGHVSNSTWFDMVSDTYKNFGQGCGEEVANEFADVWSNLNNPAGLAGLQQRLGLCQSVQTPTDVYILLFWAKQAFSKVAQFDYPRAQPPGDIANPLSYVCDAGTKDKMRAATGLIYNVTEPFGKPLSCFMYKQASEEATAPAAHPAGSFHAMLSRHLAHKGLLGGGLPIQAIPWNYLTCTEFFMPVSGTGIFSVPDVFNANAISNYCYNTYKVRPSYSWAYNYMTSVFPTATNIIFSNGEYDPCRGYSPAQNLSSTLVAINFPKMAHTYDLFADAPYDSPAILNGRVQELQILKEWLNL